MLEYAKAEIPNRKKVILVDHNEITQSVDGLEEADIIEIIDHHKLGTIATSAPINFRNMAVGCTCTIIYQIYKERNIDYGKLGEQIVYDKELEEIGIFYKIICE